MEREIDIIKKKEKKKRKEKEKRKERKNGIYFISKNKITKQQLTTFYQRKVIKQNKII